MWCGVLVGAVAGLLLLYAQLVGLLWREQRRHSSKGELKAALRLLPDVLRLLRRLARDPALPRGVRVRLLLLIGYLVLPIDLIPDFVPVLGCADDAVVVALALRSVVRRARPDAIAQHWPGLLTDWRWCNA